MKVSRDFLRRAQIMLPAFLGMGVFFVLACSSSTDPVPSAGDLQFTFEPVQSVVNLFPGQDQTFAVSPDPAVGLNLSWRLNGSAPLDSTHYRYSAAFVGIDTLRAFYSYQGTEWNHTWYLNVDESPVTIPGNVPGVSLSHGVEASSVRVAWQWIPNSVFPMVDYIIARSVDGPITMDNWENATQIGVVEHNENIVGYAMTFYEQEHGLEAGRMTWFAVRGRDSAGQLSLLNSSYSILVSSPWMVEGYVLDDELNPIPDVILDYGCPNCRVNTDATGYFSFGPVPDVASLSIHTLSRNVPEPDDPFGAWYDFTWNGVTFEEGENYDIVLPRRLGLDEGCGVLNFEFMNYILQVTRTDHATSLRDNMNLYSWEEFPLKVYVQPGYTNEFGLDMSALATEAIGFWNIAMEDEYFVLTDDPSLADVDVYFGNESTLYAGRAFITEPDDEDYRLGDVIPEHMRVYLWNQISNPQRLQETAMHEFGHVLGLNEHNMCSGGGFLMSVLSSGMLDDGPFNAVHIDEKRAVRLIRNLRQGTDMSEWEIDFGGQ